MPKYYGQMLSKYSQNFTPNPNRNLSYSFSSFLSGCSIPGSITNPYSCVHLLNAAVSQGSFPDSFLFFLYSIPTQSHLGLNTIYRSMILTSLSSVYISLLSFKPIYSSANWSSHHGCPKGTSNSACPKLNQLSVPLPLNPYSLHVYT